MNPVTCCQIRPLKSCVYKSKAEISVALSFIFILGALFLILAAAKVLPPGVNAISYLNPLGYIVGALLIGAAIYLIRKHLWQPKTKISDLPDELLVNILTYVDFNDFPSTSRVCHNWNMLSLAAKKEKQRQICEKFKKNKPEPWFCEMEYGFSKIEVDENQQIIFSKEANIKRSLKEDIDVDFVCAPEEGNLIVNDHTNLDGGEPEEFLIPHPEIINSWAVHGDLVFISSDHWIKVWNLRTKECLNELKIEGPRSFYIHDKILYIGCLGMIYTWNFQEKDSSAKMILDLPLSLPLKHFQIKDNFLFFIMGRDTLYKFDLYTKEIRRIWKYEVQKFHVHRDLVVTYSMSRNHGITLYNHVTKEKILQVEKYPDFFKNHMKGEIFPFCESIRLCDNLILFLGTTVSNKSFFLKYDFNESSSEKEPLTEAHVTGR